MKKLIGFLFSILVLILLFNLYTRDAFACFCRFDDVTSCDGSDKINCVATYGNFEVQGSDYNCSQIGQSGTGCSVDVPPTYRSCSWQNDSLGQPQCNKIQQNGYHSVCGCSAPLPPGVSPTPTPAPKNCNDWVCGPDANHSDCHVDQNTCPNFPYQYCKPGGCGGAGSPPTNVGYHDQYSGLQEQPYCSAAGWAYDSANPNPTTVNILSDGNKLINTQADQPRCDLSNNWCNADDTYCAANNSTCSFKGAGVCPSGNCGFNFNFYDGITHNVPHTIVVQGVRSDNSTWNLNNTSKSITCCTAVSAPANLSPNGPTRLTPALLACGTTTQTFTWDPVTGATLYNLKLEDLRAGNTHANIWNCALPQDPGDQCVYTTNPSYTFNGLNQDPYYLTVQEINSCGNWSGPAGTYFTVLSSLSLAPAGSINIASGSQTNFTASIVPSGAAVDSVNFTSSDITNATMSPASDTVSPYQSVATGVSSGVAVITAKAIKGGVTMCTSNSTTLNVGNNTTGWWQVNGGDVTSHGNIRSLIATTCSGACTQIFNLQGAGGFDGVNLFNGTSDYSGGAGGGTGGQGNNWNVNNAIDPSNINYATFKGQLPQDVLANMVQINSSVLGCSVVAGGVSCNSSPFSTGTLTRGYYWYHYDGSASGDLSILAGGPNGGLTISGRKIILMVENADLHINGRINMVAPGTDFFMVMAAKNAGGTKGNIMIAPTVSSASLADFAIEGIYFAENTIQTGASTNLLALQGSYVGLSGMILQRGLVDNSQSPAEYFEYAPELELSYPPLLTSKKLQWQEVAP